MRFEALEARLLLAADPLGTDTFQFSSEDLDGVELRALQSGKNVVFSDTNRWYLPIYYNPPTFNDAGQLIAELTETSPDRHTMYVARVMESQCFGADGIYTFPDTHYQISFDVRFPDTEASWLREHDWGIVMQLWGPREVGELARNPPLSIYASSDNGTPIWKLATRADSRQISKTREFDHTLVESLPPIRVGQWQHFDVEYVVDPFGGGLVRAWLDGDLVVDQQDIPTGYYSFLNGEPSGPLNPAFGLYSPSAGEQMEVHFDHILVDCSGRFGKSIAGNVNSATPGQLVTAQNKATQQVFTTNANSAGVYTLNVTPGEYHVRATDLGSGQFKTTTVDTTNQSIIANFDIDDLFKISGSVHSRTPGQAITAWNLGTDELFTTTADSNGDYLLKVPTGEYRLRARDLDTGQYLTAIIYVTTSDLVKDFQIEPKVEYEFSVTGKIVSSTPGELVTAVSSTTGEIFRTNADSHGNYILTIPADTYHLRAKDLGNGQIRTVIVDLTSSDAIRNFDIKVHYSIMGTISSPNAMSLVSATHTETGQVTQVSTDAKGGYHLRVPAGKYWLKATDEVAGQSSTIQLEVTYSDVVYNFNFERTITGTVESPTPRQVVTAVDIATEAVFRTVADPDGSYQLSVPSATYRLRASDVGTEQYSTVEMDVREGDGVRNFVIGQQRSITGTVTSANPGQLVTVLHRTEEVAITRVTADANGRYELRVDPGKYRLRARDMGTGQIRTVLIDLTDDESVVWDFYIEPLTSTPTGPVVPDPPLPPRRSPPSADPTSDISLQGDVDGDGVLDAIILGSGTLGVVASATTATVIQSRGVVNESRTWTRVLVGDFSGDGLDDVAMLDGTSQWWVQRSTGTDFVVEYWGDWATSLAWTNIRSGDFNGDGHADIIGQRADGAAGLDGQWRIALSQGDRFATTEWQGLPVESNWLSLLVGDFNGDGSDDLMFYSDECLCVAASTGIGFNFTEWAAASADGWLQTIVFDANGDGVDDLLARDERNIWTAAISDGNQFTFARWSVWQAEEEWLEVTVADINGDGLDDLVAKAAATDKWWATLGSEILGRRKFNVHQQTAWESNPEWIETLIADFDGDGMDELIGFVED